MSAFVVLVLAAVAAGWVDAVVGGGGLIQLPALLLVAPQLAPAAAVGTNKFASAAGTGVAALTYLRRVPLPRRTMALGALTAALFGAGGAALVAHIDRDAFIPLVLVALVVVGAVVIARPQLGRTAAPVARSGRTVRLVVILTAAVVAAYDGVLGPGTGTFFILVFASVLGLEFIESAAMGKVLNFGSNVGSLVLFASTGHIWFAMGLAMAAANIVGSVIGARMAITRGSGFIRAVLLVVVSAMVVLLAVQRFG